MGYLHVILLHSYGTRSRVNHLNHSFSTSLLCPTACTWCPPSEPCPKLHAINTYPFRTLPITSISVVFDAITLMSSAFVDPALLFEWETHQKQHTYKRCERTFLRSRFELATENGTVAIASRTVSKERGLIQPNGFFYRFQLSKLDRSQVWFRPSL